MPVSTTTVATAAAAAAAAALVVAYWDEPIFHAPRIERAQKATFFRRIAGRLPLFGDSLLVLGNLHRIHDAMAAVTLAYAEESAATGAPVVSELSLPFSPPIIQTIDPKVVEHVLKTHFHVYDKGPFFFSRTFDLFGHGIFAVDGDEWRVQRKTAALIFNVRNFKDYVSVVFAEEMDRLSAHLGRAADTGEVVNLHDLFFRFTLDSFCRIGFGEHLGSLTSDKPLPFATAFDDAQTHVVKRFLVPLWWVYEWVTLSTFRQARNIRTIKTFGRSIVERRMALLGGSGESAVGKGRDEQDSDADLGAALSAAAGDRADLLQYLMQSKDPITGGQPTPDQLVDYVINFIIAGRDTTAQALSWCFLMLHRNPDARRKLQAEIDAAFPAAADDGEHASYEVVRALKYANAVFHETLRLYPSVPLETKQANQTDVLPNGVVVPKGAILQYAPYAMGRSKLIWGADAAQFRPERWLDADAPTPSAFDYPVFNAGPRTCLGKNMAELEGVFVLVEIMRRFDVSVVDHEKVTYTFSLTLPMRDGMRVTLKRRQSNN